MNTNLNSNLKMSEKKRKNYIINKKPWLQPLLDYFRYIIEFNNRIENIREKICNSDDFNAIKLFIFLDFEKTGFITSKNIIHFLKKTKTNFEEQMIRSLIHTYDKDGDFNLNFGEFLNIILAIRNKTLKEKVLQSLKEKSNKNINNVATKEINILFNELIKEELFFAKTSLYAIKRIYDSPKFTTYDVFIEIVKNESYITNKNLSEFLKKYNFQLKDDNDLNMIMFRIDVNNDNKVSYPEFQDIFYPIKNFELINPNNINIYSKNKEKENIDINSKDKYGDKLNFNYDLYRFDFNRKKKIYQSLDNNYNIEENNNKEIFEYNYQNFINKISNNLEKIKNNKNINNNSSNQEKQQLKKEQEIKINYEQNKLKEGTNNKIINIKQKNKTKKDNMMIDKQLEEINSFINEPKISPNISSDIFRKIIKEKEGEKKENEKKLIIKDVQDYVANNTIQKNYLEKNNNIEHKKEENPQNYNYYIVQNEIGQEERLIFDYNKLHENKVINEKFVPMNDTKFKKINLFKNLKAQDCFRFAIKNKEKRKYIKRNFSDIQYKKNKNEEYTSITERILNKSQIISMEENEHNQKKRINHYNNLNFNSLNLYNKPKNYRMSNKNTIISSKINHELDLTNYFKFQNSKSQSTLSIMNMNKDIDINESKTSRILKSNMKSKNKALYDLLNNYIYQECEIERILEKLYLCEDFNLHNLFQTFIWPENCFSFKKKFISANDIYNTLVNLNFNNINQKDIIYIFIKFNKIINKREKNNNIGFSYDEFCKIMKPKKIPKNYINKKYQKYFMGFSFKTKRIICSLFKQIIDSEKLNEIYRKQLIGNEKNKYKIHLNAINLFTSLKNKDNDEFLEDTDFEFFLDIYGKKLKKFEKKILMQRFDRNEDGYIDFNEFFNEIVPKLDSNLDNFINK